MVEKCQIGKSRQCVTSTGSFIKFMRYWRPCGNLKKIHQFYKSRSFVLLSWQFSSNCRTSYVYQLDFTLQSIGICVTWHSQHDLFEFCDPLTLNISSGFFAPVSRKITIQWVVHNLCRH